MALAGLADACCRPGRPCSRSMGAARSRTGPVYFDTDRLDSYLGAAAAGKDR
ncbi:MAG: hypothetical protein R2755_08670 [Acidimicrobiales bacterium]